LDEPTNDLDVETLRALEAALLEFPGCAVVISHDRWFLDRIATSILWFQGGASVTRFVGNYSTVRAYRDEQEKERQRSASPAPGKAARAESGAAPSKKKGLSYKEQRELDGIEASIAAADLRVSAIDTLLSDPSFYQTRRDEAAALSAERDQKRAESDALMARWAELEEKRGA
jgi:ATP-binding cassette subfamily F protein uup